MNDRVLSRLLFPWGSAAGTCSSAPSPSDCPERVKTVLGAGGTNVSDRDEISASLSLQSGGRDSKQVPKRMCDTLSHIRKC